MIQQVNLYQSILDSQQPRPFISPFTLGLMLILLLFFVYSIYLVLDLKNTRDELAATSLQLTEANTRVQLLQIQYPKQHINKLLIQEISLSQGIQSSLARIIDLLNDKTSDQTQGFSRYFSAFARQSIADVWLNTININASEHSIKLEGSTFQAEKIPVFLQKLHHEAIFQGRNFATLSMVQAEQSNHQINFMVNTSADSEEQENHE